MVRKEHEQGGMNMGESYKTGRLVLVAALALGLLAGCGSLQTEAVYPDKVGKDVYDPKGSKKERESVFGQGGLGLFGGGKKADPEGGAGIGVNAFLWRASLDTISFMPLSSTPDPFGGVIVTDWFTPAETPNERFKLTVYILDRALRADGVRVAVFRQVKTGADDWADRPVAKDVAANLENAILTRARQLRIDAVGS